MSFVSSPHKFKMIKLPLATGAGVFVFVVCLCFIGIEVVQAIHTYQIQLVQTETAVSNVGHSVGQHVYDTLKETDVVLDSVADALGKHGAQNENLTELKDFLRRRTVSLPQINDLIVSDEYGNSIVNAKVAASVNFNMAGSDYFQHHEKDSSADLYIGIPVQSKLTGEWILNVSKRLNHRDGRFAGVVLATLRMKYFQDFYNRLNTGKEGAISVIRKDGVVLMRKPFDAAVLGNNYSTLLQKILSQSGSEGSIAKSRIDGVMRINGYQMVDAYSLIVFAALSKDEAFHEWEKDTLFRSLGVALLICIIGFTGYRMSRQIQLRTLAERNLRETHLALEEANATLRQLVKQDALTGLANRREFDLTLIKEFSRAMRLQQPISLIMIDVDFFKQYNDTYGHIAGDECLRTIAASIAAVRKRPTDLTARYGGEEMVVLLPDTAMDGAMQIAETIRLDILRKTIPHLKSPIGVVTVSAGVTSLIPKQAQTHPQDLVAEADQALYLAKNSGRNQTCSQRKNDPVSRLVRLQA